MARETSDFSLHETPSANRVHISFFGKRNAGKSSLINAVTGQSLSIVSEVKGTTTDPVKKAMELLPLGPVMVTDTPGIDDEGAIGAQRVARAYGVLRKTDAAVLVVDLSSGLSAEDFLLIKTFRNRSIPYLTVFNKADTAKDAGKLLKDEKARARAELPEIPDFPAMLVSAKTGAGIEELKNRLAQLVKPEAGTPAIIGDLLQTGDVVVLVTPIDSAAPKGRLILPQVQTIRDILDSHAVCLITQTDQLPGCLAALKAPPKLVVTDSQVFQSVKGMVPEEVKLTSFSILMARLKGILDTAASGAHHLNHLKDGDAVLISEGCTHHRQCEDIGTVKLPGFIQTFTGKKLRFEFTAGGAFPEDLSPYALVVHCGGCMLHEKEMAYRMGLAAESGTPFTNYGTLIAHINGILDRSLELFYE